MENKEKGCEYALNFDKFFELITKKTNGEKNIDSIVTEIWQPDETGELKMVNKEMVDNKMEASNNLCSVRYDFISNLLNNVLLAYSTPEGDTIKNLGQLSLGQKIIFNSFLNEGVISEIDDRQ